MDCLLPVFLWIVLANALQCTHAFYFIEDGCRALTKYAYYTKYVSIPNLMETCFDKCGSDTNRIGLYTGYSGQQCLCNPSVSDHNEDECTKVCPGETYYCGGSGRISMYKRAPPPPPPPPPPTTTTQAERSVATTTTTPKTEIKEPATVSEFPKPTQRTTYYWDKKDTCWKSQTIHEHILPDVSAFAPIAGTQPPMMRLVWGGDLKTPYFDNWYDFDESVAHPEMWVFYRTVYERMIKEYEDMFPHLKGKVFFEEFPCPCHTGVPRPPI